jgi:uncharacterized iron-regulated membrane protein
MVRSLLVWLHRWSGLSMTAFLIVVGLTGSLLAFNRELEQFFAPQLFANLQPDRPRLDLGELAECAQAAGRGGHLVFITYAEPNQVKAYFEPEAGAPAPGFDEMFLDPWSGQELGRRRRGDLSEGMINLMPFVYNLHWRLAMGDVGQWILGVVAILWTVDCFNGFFLTLPHSRTHFLRRWWLAWQVKRGAGFYRLNFDLHRAGGLWLWIMLFIFAWSSVMMNMRFVYEPVMRAVFNYQPYVSPPERPAATRRLNWREALSRGEFLIAEQSLVQGFRISEPLSLIYDPLTQAYSYEVRGGRDLFERSPQGGGTSVTFDASTGALIALSQPTGERLGNTIESWLYALHMARVFGLPYRIFVCGLGIAMVMLSTTGVYIWWKKRAAQKFHQRRKARIDST